MEKLTDKFDTQEIFKTITNRVDVQFNLTNQLLNSKKIDNELFFILTNQLAMFQAIQLIVEVLRPKI